MVEVVRLIRSHKVISDLTEAYLEVVEVVRLIRSHNDVQSQNKVENVVRSQICDGRRPISKKMEKTGKEAN